MIKIIYSSEKFSIENGLTLIKGSINDEIIKTCEPLKEAMNFAQSKGFDLNTKVYIRQDTNLFFKTRKKFQENVAYTILSFEYIVDDKKMSINIKDRYGILTILSIDHVISIEESRNDVINYILK